MHMKISFANWRPFCLCISVLTYLPTRLDNIVDIEMYADSSPFNNMASLPRRQNSWPKVHISYIQTLISRVAVRVTTKWRKQQYWTEFSPPLLNFTRLHFTSSVFYASMLHECSCHFDKKKRVVFPENDMSYLEFVYRKTTTYYSWTAGVHWLVVGSKGRTPN